MKSLKIINEQEVLGKEFKMYGTFEEPLFLAKDVAEWIEHSDVSTMLRNIDEDEKVTNIVCTLGGNQKSWFLTENGLYEVLMQSRKPIAKQFKAKVKEILKSLRTGEAKIVPMTEYQAERLKIEKAQILMELSKKYDNINYRQAIDRYITKELTGEFLIPLPHLDEAVYTTKEMAEMLGVTPMKLGRIANKYNIKNEDYGRWSYDVVMNGKEVAKNFYYYESSIPKIKLILEAEDLKT